MYCLRSCLNLAFRPIDLVINIYRRNKKLRNKGIHLLVTFIQNDNRIFFLFFRNFSSTPTTGIRIIILVNLKEDCLARKPLYIRVYELFYNFLVSIEND